MAPKKKITATPMASGVAVHCAHTDIVPAAQIIPNPRNPNMHPVRQVEVLAKIIRAQGWRAPITVSLRSGFVVRGHGRLQAALKAGLEDVPVDYQDYADEAAEWADLVADNRIAELAEMDMELLAKSMKEIEAGDFDMTLTGYDIGELAKLIDMDLTPVNNSEDEWQGMPECEADNQKAFRDIVIHFRNDGDVAQFARLLKQPVSPKAKYLWFPENEIDRVADKRWVSES